MQKKVQTVSTLLDALPFIKRFYGEIVVIKYGGAAQVDPVLKDRFAQDVVLMSLVGLKPVIVHGGGKSITELSRQLGLESTFKEGLRVTDRQGLRVAEMVLSGEINSEIVSLLNDHGARAMGMSGKDAGSIHAREKTGLGYTGEITEINADVVMRLIHDRFIPVIAPIAASREAGHPGYNINADTAASAIAGALRARKVVFMTDTPGVLDGEGELLHSLTRSEVEALKTSGVIQGGMIPKVDAALHAVEAGVEKAHILDGRIEHALLLEIFTSEGVSTEIVR